MSDPTKGIAADYSARATYARGFEDGSKHVDEVGIQFAAQSERLRLAMACVDCVRGALVRDDGIWTTTMRIAAIRALAALDAVPGDVLAKVGG